MPKRTYVIMGAVIGLAVGAGLGRLAAWLIRSDNMPFLVAFGAVAGLCIGLGVALLVRSARRRKQETR